MRVIEENIIGFTRDGKIISFDSREEYDNCDFVELNLCHIIASPQELYHRFKELEDRVEKLEEEQG